MNSDFRLFSFSDDPAIHSDISFFASRHSGGSRNPGKNWMPDQVRHDKPVMINFAMYKTAIFL
jgi:hypothetical protein